MCIYCLIKSSIFRVSRDGAPADARGLALITQAQWANQLEYPVHFQTLLNKTAQVL